jgi:murein DD-endopeptidase MepM/ murein hydrolase activator NlpD
MFSSKRFYRNIVSKFIILSSGIILIASIVPEAKAQPALPKFLTLPFRGNDVDQWGNGIRVGYVFASNHRGIDFYKSPFEDGRYGSGTVFDIIAAAPGEAYWNEEFPDASDGKLGYYVVIKHDEKDDDDKHYYTLYAHLEDNSINSRIPKQGNGTVRVERGNYLGRAGVSGATSKGIHLHFEVHRGFQQTKLDPFDLQSGRDEYYRKIANTIICGDNRLWINSPPSHSQAALHGLWTGTYTATQGETALDLTLSEENGNLYAHFSFGPLVTNPTVPEGSFYMDVEFNPNTKEIILAGREWVTRPLQPRKYYMVDLNGIVSSNIKEINGDVLASIADTTPGKQPGQKLGEFYLKKAEHILDSNDPPPTPGPTPKPDPVPTTKLGDITGNGNINVEDVTLTMQHVLGLKILTDDQKKAADVNGDGKVDVRDVVLIMRFVLGLIDNFPNQ